MRGRNFCWKSLGTALTGLSCTIRMPKGAQPGWEKLSLSHMRPNAPAEPACGGKCPCLALVDILKTRLGEESMAWWDQFVPHSSNSRAGGTPPPEEGITPREQHKSWDPNCCLLASLIKADLHFYEWLAAGRKENSRQQDVSRQCRAGRGRRQGLADLPLPQLGYFRWLVTPGFESVTRFVKK